MQTNPEFTSSKSTLERNTSSVLGKTLEKGVEICSKFNNKDTRTTSTSAWCLYCKL